MDGGKTISLALTEAGPVPVENDSFKIQFAGTQTDLKKGDVNASTLSWGFGFSTKKPVELSLVTVEQVIEGGRLLPTVSDTSPAIKNRYWAGQAPPLKMTRDVVPKASRPCIGPLWDSKTSEA